MCLAEGLPPSPHGWAYLCFKRRACAQVGAPPTPPTMTILYWRTPFGMAAATSAIRVRISTGSSPLHSNVRTPLFLFFVLFSLFSFVSRFPFAHASPYTRTCHQHTHHSLSRSVVSLGTNGTYRKKKKNTRTHTITNKSKHQISRDIK